MFGAKDFQQAAVVKRMVARPEFPAENRRRADRARDRRVAMSSRNKYLKAIFANRRLFWAGHRRRPAVVERAKVHSRSKIESDLKDHRDRTGRRGWIMWSFSIRRHCRR